MREIGKSFEHAEQLLVPRASQDLHIAGATLRAEWAKPRQLVAALRGRRCGEATERAHQVERLGLAGLSRILAEADANAAGRLAFFGEIEGLCRRKAFAAYLAPLT
jgi:hypothetical protein